MLRIFRPLCTTLVVLFALGACAQLSWAVPLTVESGAESFVGDQDGSVHEFLSPNLSVKCTGATFEGSVKSEGGQASEFTLAPTYSGCTASGSFGEGATADWKMNGCTYTFTTPSTVSNTGEVQWDPADFHILCPTEHSIEFTLTAFGLSFCTQKISAQTPTGGQIAGSNQGTSTAMDVTLAAALKGLHYSSGGCAGGSEHIDGEYRGNITLRAYAAGGTQKNITFSPKPPPGIPITGDQDGGVQRFQTPEGTIECTTATFSAYSETEVLGELTVKPHYTNCSTFGFSKNDINLNGCTYTFTTPVSLGSETVTWGGEQLHLVCPTGSQIEITPTFFGASVCTQLIGPQTPTGGHIVGVNKTSEGIVDVTLEITLSGLHYTGTGSLCGSATTHTDGSLSGKSTLRGFKNEAHTELRSIRVT